METAIAESKSLLLQSVADGWNRYVRQVFAMPLLNAEQEEELLKQLHEGGDVDAARQLVMANLRYVIYIARSYKGYGLPMEDLVQQGNVGLMKSIKRFDLRAGVRLATYAAYWIKAEIHEYILRNWRIVKVATTKAQRKLFFNLRSQRRKLQRLSKTEAEQIAKSLQVPVSDVFRMEQRLKDADCYFDESFGEHVDENASRMASSSCLEDWSNSPHQLVEEKIDSAQHRKQLREGLAALDARKRDIIERRWLQEEKTPLRELAEEYGISLERIRQLENEAMDTIRRKFKQQINGSASS